MLRGLINIMLSLKQLKKEFPYSKDIYLQPLLNIKITSKLRAAHFLGQLAHESDGFKTVQEYASGKAYEGRKDLGNVLPGDGMKYKGRGYIQLTGRANYTRAAKDLNLNLVDNPFQLLDPMKAMLVSQWFWDKHGLDAYADRDDLKSITRIINGGTNGIANRERCVNVFKRIL